MIPILKKVQSFLFISLFAIILMCILLFMHKKSTNSIRDLQKGNELAGQTFQINNALQEIVNSIYTAENSFREQLVKNNPRNTTETNTAIAKMRENARLITTLTKEQAAKDTLNQLSILINSKVLIFDKILFEWENKANAKELLYSSENSLLNDNIYVAAINIQIQSEKELQKKITENFAVSRQALSISKAFTLLAIGAILLLCTIIILHLLRNQRLIKALGLAKQNADKAANIKEQFLANMSHEIRTPVNSIIGFTNLLQKTPLQTDQEQFVNHIKSSGGNLLHIVNDILDISKMEAGMLHLQNAPYNLKELCYYIEMMFYNERTKKNIDFKYLIDDNVPEALIGDDERLKQILSNLISNAFKFTEKGFIHLSVSLANKAEQSATLIFSVKDSGIGVAKEKLATIFERFEQADSDTTKLYGGTGLGLSIVKKLITLQGGNINAESELGKGTAFTFTLPVKLPDNEPPADINNIKDMHETGEAEINFIPGYKILAAEDNKMNQLLLQYIFKQWNVNYTLAQNGAEAIEILKNETFNLLLLDIQMPVMDGYSTAKWIRNELKSDIPIIAMTAFVLQAEKDKCFACGMNEYLPKPLNETKLKQLLAKYLSVNNSTADNISTDNYDTNENAYVSLNYLKETFGDNDVFITNILKLFIKEYPKDINLLNAAITNKDVKQLKALAHNIKSTTTSVNRQPPQLKNLQALEETSIDKPDWATVLKEIESLNQSEKTVLNQAYELLKDIEINN
jgi:signal transduction histidine kinase/CheY-like chemotaxis protein/HPt (histidine-containing phosphotransfer) domain-containing protein